MDFCSVSLRLGTDCHFRQISQTRTHTQWMTQLHFHWPSTLSFFIPCDKYTITRPKWLLSVLSVNIYDWGFLVFLLLRRSLSVTVGPKSSSLCQGPSPILYPGGSLFILSLSQVSVSHRPSFVISPLSVDSFHAERPRHLLVLVRKARGGRWCIITRRASTCYEK